MSPFLPERRQVEGAWLPMRTDLVSRERELAALVEHLESALAAHPRVVLCRGEPGIGKTRMAEELTGLAATRGVPVAWGPAAESSGAPPYWPWRQVLRAVSASVDVVKIADELEVTPDLGRLAPDVFAVPGGDQGGSGSIEDRFRLFDAVARLLREITSSAPWVIVLDDVHRADYGSLLLLHHVVRTLARQRLMVMVMVMVNHRDTEPVHEVLVTGLAREPVTRRIDLRGLPAAAVGKQLAALVGHDVEAAQVQRVHAATGGNVSGRVLAHLEAGGIAPPGPAARCPTGGEFVDQLLRPLAELPELAATIRPASSMSGDVSRSAPAGCRCQPSTALPSLSFSDHETVVGQLVMALRCRSGDGLFSPACPSERAATNVGPRNDGRPTAGPPNLMSPI